MTPRFSPDGHSIVFVRERGEDSDILVIDLSTRRPRVLADASQYDLDPAVSPDGRAVVFESSPGGYAQLHLVPSDGGTIVYSCGRPSYETADLCLISPSGRFRGLLGEASQSQEIEPDWSNDGAAVAFVSDRAGNADIYLIDVDNGRITRLTDESSHDADPAWSPDDRTIAFTSDRSGKVQICLVPSSGGDVRCVVEGIQPSWSPDGRELTFYRSTSEGTRIFTARVDGSDVVQIS
jgi:TolB protein